LGYRDKGGPTRPEKKKKKIKKGGTGEKGSAVKTVSGRWGTPGPTGRRVASGKKVKKEEGGRVFCPIVASLISVVVEAGCKKEKKRLRKKGCGRGKMFRKEKCYAAAMRWSITIKHLTAGGVLRRKKPMGRHGKKKSSYGGGQHQLPLPTTRDANARNK